jgi:hypothetical protein
VANGASPLKLDERLTNEERAGGPINANGSWAVNVDRAGDQLYGCSFHPTVKGEIHVH